MKKLNDYIRKNPWLIPVVLIAFYFAFKKVKGLFGSVGSAIKNNAIAAVIDQSIADNNISPIRTQIIMEIVNDIHNAFYAYFFGAFEDERAAIEAFRRLNTIDEAIAASVIYRASFNKGLWADLDKYCMITSSDGINQTYLNAIKNK